MEKHSDLEELIELPLPVEFQDWVLIAVTFTMLWLVFLPWWCSGLPYKGARHFAVITQRHLFLYE